MDHGKKLRKVSWAHVAASCREVGILKEQAEKLWGCLVTKTDSFQWLSLINVCYYLGGICLLLALWVLLRFSNAFERLPFLLAYSMAFCSVGIYLWRSSRWKTVGGMFASFSVISMTWLAYDLGCYLKWWISFQDTGMITPEPLRLSVQGFAIVATSIAIYFVRFPFLSVLIYLAIGWGILEVGCFLDAWGYRSDPFEKWALVVLGLASIGVSAAMDQKTKEDFSFWGYLAGGFYLWFGLWPLQFRSAGERLVAVVMYALMMVLGSLLRRGVLVLLGVIGMFCAFFFFIQEQLFAAIPFSFALIFCGLGIIALTALCQYYTKRKRPS